MDTHSLPDVYAQSHDGRWSPAVPLPYCYGPSWRFSVKGCHCGRRFLTRARYEAHYRAAHLGLQAAGLSDHEIGWRVLVATLLRRGGRR